MLQQDADVEKVLGRETDPDPIPQASKEDIKWVQDPSGFFTIKPFPKEGIVRVRFYEYANKDMTQWKKKYLFEGTNTSAIFQKIFDMGILTRLEHAAYLGKEIERALLSMKHGFKYVQD